jgi:hypothetical protein
MRHGRKSSARKFDGYKTHTTIQSYVTWPTAQAKTEKR